MLDSGPITIVNSILNSNTGSVFYLVSVTFDSSGFLEIQSNIASTSVLYAVGSTLNLSGNTTVSNNYGSLFVYSCKVTFMGYTNIMNNHYRTNTYQEGGAVTSFQSEIVFMGTANLMYNTGLYEVEPLQLHRANFICMETLPYLTTLHQCLVEVSMPTRVNSTSRQNVNISRNRANDGGGGIHVISSTTRLRDGC